MFFDEIRSTILKKKKQLQLLRIILHTLSLKLQVELKTLLCSWSLLELYFMSKQSFSNKYGSIIITL